MTMIKKASFILGIILALSAAFLMFNGSILGEDVTGPALVLGIVAIGLIASGKEGSQERNYQ